MSTMRSHIFPAIFLLCFGTFAIAEELVNESEMFNETSSVIETGNIMDDAVGAILEQESVSFTGSILSKGIYAMDRSWIEKRTGWNNNTLTNYTDANLFLDVRLKKGVKAFINLEVANAAQKLAVSGNSLAFSVKEFFIDMNVNQGIYFRTGKQVLQWGRTYFWNPTDLINIEKRSFLNINHYREGVYGTKVHVPFGASKNIYLFWDFSEAGNFDRTALAGKLEFLIDNSELAFSAWKKKGSLPVYGFDYSTKAGDVDVKGEVSLSYGENRPKLIVDDHGNVSSHIIKDRWIPKASLGLTKSFEWELKDRINVIAEFYYNNSRYNKNMFKNSATRSTFINNYYEQNYSGVYYAALFTTINKYPITDMTFNTNIISNLSDGSAILAMGVGYVMVNNFTIGCALNSFLGPKNAEYTYSDTKLSADVTTTIVF